MSKSHLLLESISVNLGNRATLTQATLKQNSGHYLEHWSLSLTWDDGSIYVQFDKYNVSCVDQPITSKAR